MIRSGLSIGRPRIIAFTIVNIVPFMPIPSANARTAGNVNRRSFNSRRAANRRSCAGVVHPPRSTRIAATLLERIISAKIETGAATGLLLGHSHPNVVSHLTIEVIPKLGVELTLESIAGSEGAATNSLRTSLRPLKNERDSL